MKFSSPIPDPEHPDRPPDDGHNLEFPDDLLAAADLWSLVDPERSRRIRSILDDARGDIPSYHWWIETEEMNELASLLDGLVPALSPFIDADWHLRPERAGEVIGRFPDHVTSWEADGKPVHTLGNAIARAVCADRYLRQALSAGRTLVYTFE